MRIAFLVGPFPVPSKTFILDQITGLLDRGFEIDIFAEKTQKNEILQPGFIKYNLASRVHYPKTDLPQLFKRFLFLPFPLFGHKDRRILPLFRTLNYKKFGVRALSLRQFYEAVNYIKYENYDIIHAHFGTYGVEAQKLREIGVFRSKRIITSFHGFDLSVITNKFGNNFYSDLFAAGDLFLPISKFWEKKLITLGCSADKIRVHHMGINCDKFQLRTPRQIGEKLKLVSVARLTEKKGLEFAIKAAALLIKNNSTKIDYKIIGDGELMKPLRLMIEKYNLEENIALLGWQDQNRVIDILQKSDILLAPSITAADSDMEGIPMVLMEAMAMGIPVISTYHSGIPELIKDGETGLLTPEKDPDGLAEKIKALQVSQNLHKKITLNARKFVESEFNVERQNDKLVKIYNNCV